jgi:hypothetical protein
MENKTYQQFLANIWLSLSLAAILLTGCAPDETPPTAAPIVVELTATPATATATVFTPSTSPLPTPTPGRTATPT